jgi:hypothetical protein
MKNIKKKRKKEQMNEYNHWRELEDFLCAGVKLSSASFSAWNSSIKNALL